MPPHRHPRLPSARTRSRHTLRNPLHPSHRVFSTTNPRLQWPSNNPPRSNATSTSSPTPKRHQPTEGLSHLEWLAAKRYNYWHKRVMEDPYRALFGASEDMLRGRGLRSWEVWKGWIREAEEGEEKKEKEQQGVKGTEPKSPERAGRQYPRKVEIQGEDEKAERGGGRVGVAGLRFEEKDERGVVSPSDPRRPREFTGSGVVRLRDRQIQREALASRRTAIDAMPQDKTRHSEINRLRDSFSAVRPENDEVKSHNKGRDDDVEDVNWRQTAVQRRTPFDSLPSFKPDDRPSASTSSPSWRSTLESTLESSSAPRAESTSEILSKLPKDDIDFLSADDIRASMGSKRSIVHNKMHREVERRKLEASFADVHDKPQDVDQLVESKVLNDQHERRAERARRAEETIQTQDEAATTTIAQTPRPTESTLTTSTATVAGAKVQENEPTKSWLEEVSEGLVNVFWQNPTQDEQTSSINTLVNETMNSLRRGRKAMQSVTEDIHRDIAASRPLLRRLEADEALLDQTINALRRQLNLSGSETSRTEKLIKVDKLSIHSDQIDRDLDKACKALLDLSPTLNNALVPSSLKRSIQIAALMSRKNAKLTRGLGWNLQTRVDTWKIESEPLVARLRDVVYALRVVSETHTAVARLIDVAAIVYKIDVSQKLPERLKAKVEESVDHVKDVAATQVDSSNVISKTQEPGEPQATVPKAFEKETPLVHSLFRPFALVLDGLGSGIKPKDDASGLAGSIEGVATKDTTASENVGSQSDTGKLKHDQFMLLLEDVRHGKVSVSEAASQLEQLRLEVHNEGSAEAVEAADQVRAVEDVAAVERDETNDVRPFELLKEDPMVETIKVKEENQSKRTVSSVTPDATSTSNEAQPPVLPFAETHPSTPDTIAKATTPTASRTDIAEEEQPAYPRTERVRPRRWAVNPIDGTTRLSPTGYSGVDGPAEAESRVDPQPSSQYQTSQGIGEQDAATRSPQDTEHAQRTTTYEQRDVNQEPQEERWQDTQYEQIRAQRAAEREARTRGWKDRRERRGGGVASVFRTAIWAGAVCYIVGVFGEVVSAVPT